MQGCEAPERLAPFISNFFAPRGNLICRLKRFPLDKCFAAWQKISMNKLKQLLCDRKMTAHALAKASGVSPSTVLFHLNGKRDPTMSFLRKYASALGLAVSEILDDEDFHCHTDKRKTSRRSGKDQRKSERRERRG